ncbi:MAG: glycosyltransferase family 39 protein [Oscillospiraceae bacterium]|jgi:hypothetical protein|nr:glycosyltransferase family 39 protein [Oscillospiraceae bacterium]
MRKRFWITLKSPAVWILGAIYAAVGVLGLSLEETGGLSHGLLPTAVLIIVFTPIMTGLCAAAFFLLNEISAIANNKRSNVRFPDRSNISVRLQSLKYAQLKTRVANLELSSAAGARSLTGMARKLKGWQKFLMRFGLIFAAWLPLFISAYPGFFCYDAYSQWNMVRNSSLTAHHPPLHTLILGYGVENLARLTGSYNAGIAFYLVLQMLLLACVFAYVLRRMDAWGIGPLGRGLTMAYFALFPTIAFFAASTTKDTLFSAAVLLFAVFLTDAVKSPKLRRWWIGAAVFGLLAMLLRNNAVYAFIPFALLFLLIKKPLRKFALPVFAGIFTAAILVTSVVYPKLMNIPDGSIREAFCVPMQQLARVYNIPGSLTKQEKQAVEKFITPVALKVYDPQWADLVKNGFRDDAVKENMGEFLALWAKIGLAHPKEYADSFLLNTVQGWLPNAVIDGYNSPPSMPRLYPYDGSSYFEFNSEYPVSAVKSPLPTVRNFYLAIAKTTVVNKIPLLGLLFSPGALLMFLLFCLARAAFLRRKGSVALALPLLFVLFLSGTIFLGPIMLPRYFLPMFFTLPLCAASFLKPRQLQSATRPSPHRSEQKPASRR